MSYLSINNLYKDQRILAFKECYALEKVHGTSAHVSFQQTQLGFFSGGEKHEKFVALFDQVVLLEAFKKLGHPTVIVFGEAYGGKCQGMKETYGDKLQFIAFDVKIGDSWLSVPDAKEVTSALGLEFVYYEKGPTDLAWLDVQRDALSELAIRRGITTPKNREGVVLRPPFEVTTNNGERIIAKHKRDDFSERATPQKVVSVEQLAVLSKAGEIAAEWVSEMRLSHVIDKMKAVGIHVDMACIPELMKHMIADIEREASGEIVASKEARRAIGSRTVAMFKARLKSSRYETEKEEIETAKNS